MHEEAVGKILRFWFAPGRSRQWFVEDPEFDAAVREHLGPCRDQAEQGLLESWKDTPEGTLALVLLLDQAPRNLFRGSPRAFATDATARRVAAEALARGFDRRLGRQERLFLYLPFQHSENLADQERCCALMAAVGDPDWSFHAEQHRETIARFGRFPHRNSALGRSSTSEELAFLGEPDSGTRGVRAASRSHGGGPRSPRQSGPRGCPPR